MQRTLYEFAAMLGPSRSMQWEPRVLKFNRTAVLATALLVSVCFIPPINGVLLNGVQAVRDFIDGRPERTALFIGNSRTFYNNMPQMVRAIADSAGHPERLRIEMDAQPGVSLSDHADDPKTHILIAEGWDHVVLQVLSSEQYSAAQSDGVWEAAARFIAEVRETNSQPAMFVTWRYTDQCTPGEGLPPSAVGLPTSGYANMHANIQSQHALLAETTGVDLVMSASSGRACSSSRWISRSTATATTHPSMAAICRR